MKPGAKHTAGAVAAALLAAAALAACGGEGGPGLEGLRFGQIGEVRLRLEVPRERGLGLLEQELLWSSTGPFRFEEAIYYEGELGDRTVTRVQQNPDMLAREYASWIVEINDRTSVTLFDGRIDPTLDPDCAALRMTRLTLSIRDDVRNETVSWTRCVNGNFGSDDLTRDARPDSSAAARVVQAAVFLRPPTVGPDFTSTYQETVPFATIDKGEDTNADLDESRVITEQSAWELFWAEHSGGSGIAPAVDFERDLVLVGAVGVRQEAGDSVEVRGVLPTGPATFVRVVERIPGDFCSPVSRTHTPFHIVRTPRDPLPLPVQFITLEPELVPCGI
ncbi:MAG: hypothetical protein PVI57_16140 [Gemmatimonadota bacterium]